MSISTVDRDAAGAPFAGEAADGGAMPVAKHMSRGSENHGGASLDHGTQRPACFRASLDHGTLGQAGKILGAMAKPGIPGRRHAVSRIPHGGVSLDHGTQENDGTPENRGTHGARRTCFRFAGSMAPTPISPMPPDDATGKLRLPMPPGVGRLRERLEDYRGRRAKQAGWTRRFVPTGLAALDAALPHGGLPCGAVTEILADDVGVGSMTLALRIAARCAGMIDDDRASYTGSGGLGDPTGKSRCTSGPMPSGAGMIDDDRGLGTGLDDSTGKLRLPMPPGRILHEPSIHASAAREARHPTPGAPGSARADQEDRRCLVVVDTGNDFYPPAARQHGIELDRLIVVRVRRREEAFWVVDQALRCRAVAVVIAALPQLDDRQSRRLQLAAESTGGIGLILRSGRRRTKSFAAVRMRVEGVSCITPLLAKEGLGEVPDSSCNPPVSPLGKGGRKRCNLSGNGRVPCLPRSGDMGVRMLRESSTHASAAREACHPTDDPTGKLRLPMPPGHPTTGKLGWPMPPGGSARAYHDDRDVYYCRIELMTVREGKPVEPILVDLHHETGDVSLHAVPVDRPVAGTG